ncbi:DHA2 family efflux MFS transporter permease subunit [Aestuariicella hydrocarbonica]|uniref:DHA2 family efflux MFS transporter permease subunit n=1 Tax=Pseudomaricurvus hydrocarbonicus TaxID=1470433 RepID=A0A9E5MLT5_9GAMM|nr:DHA2 family efflux MFS transporter permease subunit [Aestuariicella hydrocarbonica]NHO65438.1 DHA2 family efflux MFS transporter permease subunit [Aestuariicella hydrocarbonica]
MSESTPAVEPVKGSTQSGASAQADPLDQASLASRHPRLLMIAVMCVSLIQILDITIANVALPHMQASLGATSDTISWVLTSFIIAGVLVTPIVGWVSDRLGSRQVFLWAVAGFLLASVLCGAATSLSQMVAFRAFQGICAAFIGPMSQTILFDTTKPSKQASAMSLWGMVIMIGPITGPMLGGLLTDTLSWRWVFYVNLPIGIPTLLLLVWLLPSRPLVPRKLDRFGFFILATGLVALQLLLDRGSHKDWFSSWEIILEMIIALSAFWMFFIHTRYTKVPLFPSVLLKNANFLGAMGVMFMLGVANIAISSILPTMFQTVYGYTALDTGMLMMPRGLGVMMTMMLAGKLSQRLDVRYMITVGYLLAAFGLVLMSRWSLEMGSTEILVAGFIQGLGLGLIFMPMNIAAFATVAPEHRPDGSSLLNLMRNLGGSFGISAIFTMLSRSQQVSHAGLTEHVTENTLQGFDVTALTSTLGQYGSAVLQMLDAEVNRQALMISYLNNFHAMAMLIFVIALIPLFMKPIRLH